MQIYIHRPTLLYAIYLSIGNVLRILRSYACLRIGSISQISELLPKGYTFIKFLYISAKLAYFGDLISNHFNHATTFLGAEFIEKIYLLIEFFLLKFTLYCINMP
jgi:hypothetical protein